MRIDRMFGSNTVHVNSIFMSEEQREPELTERQREVLDFVRNRQEEMGAPPTLREIAVHFGFRSMNAAADHVRALRRKGFLEQNPGLARSLRVTGVLGHLGLRRMIAHVPIYGTIPAGLAESRQQEALGCLSIDVGTLGVRAGPRTFALEVRGDSMIGKHIVDGDVVVLEHGMTPKSGDVVAALIDNESTLKTFMVEKGKLYLRAENPKYPQLIPAEELVIQGVMVALVRKRRERKRAA